MTVFGMDITEFAIIVVLVALVVLRLAYRMWRAQEFRKRKGDDRSWWESTRP